MARNRLNQAPKSADVKLPLKAVLILNFSTPLRTTDVDTETTRAENALPEQEALRKSGRLPPVVMTSTTNLI
jgi:hypothetical protein